MFYNVLPVWDIWELWQHVLNFSSHQLKSFIAKQVNSILVNLRYLRFKLLKYKENNKKICNTFDHNFKNILLYIMRKVSLERYYFVLYDGALTLNMSKWRLTRFAIKLFNYLDWNIISLILIGYVCFTMLFLILMWISVLIWYSPYWL